MWKERKRKRLRELNNSYLDVVMYECDNKFIVCLETDSWELTLKTYSMFSYARSYYHNIVYLIGKENV